MTSPDEIRSRAAGMMPELLADLERLVGIPSVAFPGYPPEPVQQMADQTLGLFREAGFANVELQEVPTGYPPHLRRAPRSQGRPDRHALCPLRRPAGPPEQGWTSDPWTATRKPDGPMYGRGAADDKGGLVVHLGTLRSFDGKPPCTLKLILEGMEETDSNLEAFVQAHPELFACDLFIVCDMGNLRVGEPTLTTTLRGEVVCVVTVRTLQHPLHSGEFGGPAPDAMVALARLLATLHDEEGNVAVQGVQVERVDAVPGFRCATDGPGYAAAQGALEEAYGKPAGEAGSGGSIPLLQTLQQAAPNAEFILWGPEDLAAARIHASDESVDPYEIERMILAQALLLQRLAGSDERLAASGAKPPAETTWNG